jgi:gamma-glutamylcyclotransferase
MSKIFTYGSLLRSLCNHSVLKDSTFCGFGLCEGILRDCGAYPALTPGNGTVVGEVFEVSEEVIQVIDRIESYYPEDEDEERSLYVRRAVPVRSFNDGKWIDCYVYLMLNGADHYPIIEAGDYRRHEHERKSGNEVSYIAIGSNLNPARLKERIGSWGRVIRGSLPGFKLVFNKKSAKEIDVAYANITTGRKEDRCPCVIYEVDKASIETLDYFEGHPRHYLRTVVPVEIETGEVLMGQIYLGHPKMLVEKAKVSEAYLHHIKIGYMVHNLGDLEMDTFDRKR